jgi:hypothetical protein
VPLQAGFTGVAARLAGHNAPNQVVAAAADGLEPCERWGRGDIQARRLKAESRGCSGGLISSLGEVRPLSYLS